MNRTKARFLVKLLSILVVAFATYGFNRVMVYLTWPLLNKVDTPEAVGWNMALLSSLYIIVFYLLSPLLQKLVLFIYQAPEQKKPISRLVQIFDWVSLKILFTPLELLSGNIGTGSLNSFFFLSGVSQMTLGSVILASVVTNISVSHILLAFAVQLFTYLAALELFRFNYLTEVKSVGRTNLKPIVYTVVTVSILFYLTGLAGEFVLQNFGDSVTSFVSNFFISLNLSNLEANQLARQWVQRWFLTERSVMFSWAGFNLAKDSLIYWASLLSMMNFFNLFSCGLLIPLIGVWMTGSLQKKVKTFFVTVFIGFLISHLPTVLLLLAHKFCV